jgi:hypothetical protein
MLGWWSEFVLLRFRRLVVDNGVLKALVCCVLPVHLSSGAHGLTLRSLDHRLLGNAAVTPSRYTE